MGMHPSTNEEDDLTKLEIIEINIWSNFCNTYKVKQKNDSLKKLKAYTLAKSSSREGFMI